MVKKSQLERGKKWVTVRDVATFENRMDDVKWLETQPSIVDDIKAYEDNLPQTKSIGKK